jgi:hypothetical protein
MQHYYAAMLSAVVYHRQKHHGLFRFQVCDWHFHRFLGLPTLLFPLSVLRIGLRCVLRTCSIQAVVYHSVITVTFLSCILVMAVHSSSVRSTPLRIRQPRNRVLFPGMGRRSLCPPDVPYLVWFPSSCLHNCYPGLLSPGIKQPVSEAHCSPPLVPRLSMSGTIPPLPHNSS